MVCGDAVGAVDAEGTVGAIEAVQTGDGHVEAGETRSVANVGSESRRALLTD